MSGTVGYLVCVVASLLLVTQIYHSDAQNSQVTFTTSTNVIETGVTPSLTLNCSFPPQSPVGYRVISMSIRRVGENSPLTQIATVDAYGHFTALSGINYTVLNGHVNSTQGSYIRLGWLHPGTSMAGTYICSANVIDQLNNIYLFQLNKTVTTATTTTNTGTTTAAGVSDLMQRIAELETALNSLKIVAADQLKLLESTLAQKTAKANNLEAALFKKSAYNGHQYYLSLYEPHSAADAEMACESLDGYLAEVDTQEEFSFLKSFIGTPIADSIEFLLGGTDERQEGHWINRHSGGVLGYVEWSSGEPSNSEHNGIRENCQTVALLHAALKMSDSLCFKPTPLGGWYFICESPVVA
ncbi:unnamed protein product [Lymnaea stagnalis]|uniref:C-type lectin domain-containing protein n=1 Tax=Lymnaea stagnalis TaxID=6523 RepID=A0AAV2IPK2_LYMST